MKNKILKLTTALLILSLIAVSACKIDQAKKEVLINGAGATFPYPLYSEWSYKYNNLTGMKLNYQSIGSGGGIAQIKAKTVDFGASDAPMESAKLDEFGLVQFPMVIGGVVPVINVKGIEKGALKLKSETLADIYMGKVSRWNDQRIKDQNPGINLPDQAITVVHRADGSGTTWIFTNYLSKISEEWKTKVGSGTAVSWPAGIGGKGNEGVSAYVQRVDGSIGYVEYAYALQNKMNYVRLENKAGKFVEPTIDSFQAAASNADWKNAPGFYMVLTDQPGENSWPITGASFILMHKEQQNPEKARLILGFFDWCQKHGAGIAMNLHYVPMPEEINKIIHDEWRKKITSMGKAVWE